MNEVRGLLASRSQPAAAQQSRRSQQAAAVPGSPAGTRPWGGLAAADPDNKAKGKKEEVTEEDRVSEREEEQRKGKRKRPGQASHADNQQLAGNKHTQQLLLRGSIQGPQ